METSSPEFLLRILQSTPEQQARIRDILDGKKGELKLYKLGFSRREAATMLGISPASLDRLVERGLLKPSRALRKTLFSRQELERFLRESP